MMIRHVFTQFLGQLDEVGTLISTISEMRQPRYRERSGLFKATHYVRERDLNLAVDSRKSGLCFLTHRLHCPLKSTWRS